VTSTWIWRGGHLPNTILASLVNSGKGCCALNVSRIPAILWATLLLLSFPCKISCPPSFPKTNLLRNSKWLQEVECWSLFSFFFSEWYTSWVPVEYYEKNMKNLMGVSENGQSKLILFFIKTWSNFFSVIRGYLTQSIFFPLLFVRHFIFFKHPAFSVFSCNTCTAYHRKKER